MEGYRASRITCCSPRGVRQRRQRSARRRRWSLLLLQSRPRCLQARHRRQPHRHPIACGCPPFQLHCAHSCACTPSRYCKCSCAIHRLQHTDAQQSGPCSCGRTCKNGAILRKRAERDVAWSSAWGLASGLTGMSGAPLPSSSQKPNVRVVSGRRHAGSTPRRPSHSRLLLSYLSCFISHGAASRGVRVKVGLPGDMLLDRLWPG